MDKTLIIVCAVVGSLGVLSAIFGFSAEGTKLTPYDILVLDDGECFYPPNPALGLGISAAVFLLATQVTFTAVGGCCGCCNKSRSSPSPSETKRILGIVCAVVSWIAAVIAFALFIDGASWNANVVRSTDNCEYLKDGIFAGAGVLSLAATALGVTSYVLMRTKRVKAAAPPPAVVPAGGEPKLPPAVDTSTTEPGGTAAAAPAVVVAAAASAPAVAMGQLLPQVPLPQGHLPSNPLPYSDPAPLVGGMDIPGGTLPSAAAPAEGSGGSSSSSLSTVIRNEVARQGVTLVAEVVKHSLFPDN